MAVNFAKLPELAATTGLKPPLASMCVMVI